MSGFVDMTNTGRTEIAAIRVRAAEIIGDNQGEVSDSVINDQCNRWIDKNRK